MGRKPVEIIAKAVAEVLVDKVADAIEKSQPKNAADDQREADRLKELEHVAVLGGAHD